MENTSENIACQLWFNASLFVINNQPLKFYLFGYNSLECRDISRIIEAYGGKLSAPDGETIVFSEPQRVTRHTYDLYHIKCLYDSIMMNQLQDITRYRLFSPSHSLSPITPDSSSSALLNDRSSDFSGCVPFKCKEEPPEADWDIHDRRVTILDFLEHTKDVKFFQTKSEALNSGTTKKTYDSPSSWEDKVRENPPADCAQGMDPEEFQSLCTSSEEARAFPQENGPLECSGDATVDESSPENSISPARKRRVREVNGELKEVTLRGRSLQWQSYEELPTDISSCEELDSRSSNRRKRKRSSRLKRHSRSTPSQAKSPSSDQQSTFNSRVRFTEEEDRLIIKYLIDNNAISKATGVDMWNQFKASVMPNSTRTPTNLRYRYMYYIRYNYAKYTDDPEVLAEFADNVRNKRKRYTWSELESKKLIHYLIKFDVFSRPFGTKIWEEAAEEKIITDPEVSWRTLRRQFFNCLLPVIDKYVYDPELIEQFRILRLRRSKQSGIL